MFSIPFNQTQILFTLLLAGQMILLIVLYGRDRTRLHPWFAASVMLTAFKELVDRLLFERVPQIPYEFIKDSLAFFTVLVSIGVLIEVGLQLFPGVAVKSRLLAGGAIGVLAGIVVYLWGPWAANGDIGFKSQIGVINLLLIIASHSQQVLVPSATVLLGLLGLFALRGKHGVWRTHTAKILAGLTTIALMFLVVRAAGQSIAIRANAHGMTPKEFAQIEDLMDHLRTLPFVTLIIVQIWWINALWKDEPVVKKLEG